MKKFMVFAAVFLTFICAWTVEKDGTEPLKVLTVGNSFADSVFFYLPAIARAEGKKLILERANLGGCSLKRHMTEAAKCEKNPAYKPYEGKYSLQDKLTSRKWDIVTIQQVSTQSWKPESFHPHIDNLVACIRKYAPRAEIVIQQTWAYRVDSDRLAKWKITQDEMFKRLTAAYEKEAASFGFRMIPVGYALKMAYETQKVRFVPVPKKTLDSLIYPKAPEQTGSFHVGWRWVRKAGSDKRERFLAGDFAHLNMRGSYLQACVWYAFLFRSDAGKIRLTPKNIAAEDAAFLRDVARKTVAVHSCVPTAPVKK